jgi:hypothetical protein
MANNGQTGSQAASRTGAALDLDPTVFTWPDPTEIARPLKRSAERSERRTTDPFRSAMSMLTFCVNRAGNRLDPAQRERLEQLAKDELRFLYGRPQDGILKHNLCRIDAALWATVVMRTLTGSPSAGRSYSPLNSACSVRICSLLPGGIAIAPNCHA